MRRGEKRGEQNKRNRTVGYPVMIAEMEEKSVGNIEKFTVNTKDSVKKTLQTSNI